MSSGGCLLEPWEPVEELLHREKQFLADEDLKVELWAGDLVELPVPGGGSSHVSDASTSCRGIKVWWKI